jgi:hypothetical protein
MAAELMLIRSGQSMKVIKVRVRPSIAVGVWLFCMVVAAVIELNLWLR